MFCNDQRNFTCQINKLKYIAYNLRCSNLLFKMGYNIILLVSQRILGENLIYFPRILGTFFYDKKLAI